MPSHAASLPPLPPVLRLLLPLCSNSALSALESPSSWELYPPSEPSDTEASESEPSDRNPPFLRAISFSWQSSTQDCGRGEKARKREDRQKSEQQLVQLFSSLQLMSCPRLSPPTNLGAGQQARFMSRACFCGTLIRHPSTFQLPSHSLVHVLDLEHQASRNETR